MLFLILSKVSFLLSGLSSLLGPSGFWRLALPVGVCRLECINNSNIGIVLNFILILAIPIGDALWDCRCSFFSFSFFFLFLFLFFRHNFVRPISLELLLAETPN